MRQSRFELLRFPLRGQDSTVPRTDQLPLTTVDSKNVRIRDSLERRYRGGIRPGLSKYTPNQLDGSNYIQDISSVVTVANSAATQGSLSVRTITPVAVANGTIATFTTSSFTNATVTGSRTLSNTAPFIFSTELFGRRYFCDGSSYKIYTQSNTTAHDWTPTVGSLPGTDGTRACRLIEQWRSRIVMAGLVTDPHNWFMSKLGDPLDWDTSPTETTQTQAVAGGVGVVGKIPEIINCIIPMNDDIVIFGSDHSISICSGDPADGAVIDLLTNSIGMAYGRPWCQDSVGNIFFFSSRGHIYHLPGPQTAPVSLTQDSIEPELEDINLNTTIVRMAYDEREAGFYVFLTPFTTGAATHWFYDMKTKGWFKTVFGDNDHNARAVHVLDGDDPADRVILLGTEDGYINKVDSTVANDDGTAIEATVTLGPIKNENGQPFVVSELQAIVDQNSATINYQIKASDTPEQALDDFPAAFTNANRDGTFAPGSTGKSTASNPRVGGYYAYLKVGTNTTTAQWAFENIRAKISTIVTEEGRQIGTD